MSQRKSMQPEEAKDSKEQTLEEAKQQFEAAHEKGMKSFQAPTIEQHLQQLGEAIDEETEAIEKYQELLAREPLPLAEK
jgi:hypothetical protein